MRRRKNSLLDIGSFKNVVEVSFCLLYHSEGSCV